LRREQYRSLDNTMGRKISKKTSVMDLSEFRMTLHTDQQSIIFGEMIAARKNLEEENTRLRDELQDAQMMVHLLKLKMQENKKYSEHHSAMGSQDSTVELSGHASAIPGRYIKALEWAHKRRSKKRQTSRDKGAFKNPAAPGKKTFKVDPSLDMTPKEIRIPVKTEMRSLSAPRLRHGTNPRGERPRKPVTKHGKGDYVHQSSVGKIAETLIQEYSHTTDATEPVQCN
jgi:hypothetical protein